MLLTVYYLVHKDTGRRLKWYRTRAGARIAQRARNSHLGFRQRIQRVEIADNWECEQCEHSGGGLVTATYCIVEDVIEQNDLLV